MVVMLLGCQTDELRAWTARRVELEQRQAELQKLEAHSDRADTESAFRKALDLPGLVRERGLTATRVFVEPGVVRIMTAGTIQNCRDAVAALAGLRWLTAEWRLRLEADACEWEARTGPDFTTLQDALMAVPAKWMPPPRQLLSGGMEELRKSVESLDADVRARESRLGELALLQGRLEAVKPLVDSLHARPPPCDVAVLDRELALDEPDQGKLLEVERVRLVHPLEPRGDFRLRGLVEVHDGALAWHCEPL